MMCVAYRLWQAQPARNGCVASSFIPAQKSFRLRIISMAFPLLTCGPDKWRAHESRSTGIVVIDYQRGQQRICYRPCGNRHCPKCQSLARAEWIEDRQAELLNCEYFHVVYTIPDKIAAIAY